MQPLMKRAQDLETEITAAYERLRIDDKVSDLNELDKQLAHPDVWHNPEHAQNLSKQAAALRSMIEPWQTLKMQAAVEISKSGQIVLLATAATVASSRYKILVERYAGHTTIHTPATTTWATQIEARTGADINLSETRQAVDAGADVIVLACTHYLAIEQMLRDMFPDVTVIEPTRAVADRISTVVSQPQR